jgi:transcription elongation factor Elf1
MSITDPYTAIAPQCPCCTAEFDQTAEHKNTLIDDGQLLHLVECGQCGHPWEVIIDYSDFPVNGIEIWVEPDIIEQRFRHREQDASDLHVTLPEFASNNQTGSTTDEETSTRD